MPSQTLPFILFYAWLCLFRPISMYLQHSSPSAEACCHYQQMGKGRGEQGREATEPRTRESHTFRLFHHAQLSLSIPTPMSVLVLIFVLLDIQKKTDAEFQRLLATFVTFQMILTKRTQYCPIDIHMISLGSPIKPYSR